MRGRGGNPIWIQRNGNRKAKEEKIRENKK